MPTYRELLRDLVREPSTLGNERAAQLAVSRALRRQGLEPTLYDLDLGLLGRHAAFAPTGLSYTARPNLSATWPAPGNGRSLVLNGHIDVVSAEPESWWTHAPFSGTVDRGRLYGRGAYDMKGGLVAAMLALHAVRDALPPLQGAVHFESVIEEECTGNGTLAARLRGPTVDAALIAEPTDLHVWLATLGVIWFELTVVGRPAYVGQAGAYVNAIEKACDVVVALRAIPEELNRAFSHPLFPSGAKPLTLNIGRIHGGDWASNVPLECTITGRMSFPIDWPVERAQRLLEERVAQHAASDPWLADHPPAIHYPGFRAAGWQADPDQPLLQLLDQVVRAVVGEPLTRTVFAGTADARYFGPSGGVVFFGPAGGNQHAPDEYLDLDSFVAAARIIALLMAEWCSQERQ